jgi:hypothetical protein
VDAEVFAVRFSALATATRISPAVVTLKVRATDDEEELGG